MPERGHNTVRDTGKIVNLWGIPGLTVQDCISSAKKRSYWTYETGCDDLNLIIKQNAIKRVQAAAVLLSTIGDYKPQWYCSVQWPLLDIAFRY